MIVTESLTFIFNKLDLPIFEIMFNWMIG
ncbi:uncharacterized protein METZ01_LOCUS288595 [marine metagenome]|uniref:Uncharacterized protein n=1 Tax=marine metagenome TaxID=408172 RepID=A0A382LLH7_9ZZZZ